MHCSRAMLMHFRPAHFGHSSPQAGGRWDRVYWYTTITTVACGQSPAQLFATNLPTQVRSLFSRVQARRDRPTPCPLFDGVGMVVGAHDSAHLACVQCVTVSCGGTEDTSC